MRASLSFILAIAITMITRVLSLRKSSLSRSVIRPFSDFHMTLSTTVTSSSKASQLAAGLSPEQFRAVHCSLSSKAIVVSGPGSGKTGVLTKRIVHLLQKNQRASSILALTFTNKAASEMRERVKHLLEDLDVASDNDSNFDYMFVGTFHAFCVRMLRTFGKDYLKTMTNSTAFDANFSIMDTDDSSKFIKEIMTKKKISTEEFKPLAVLGAVQKVKLAKLMSAWGLDTKGDPLPSGVKDANLFNFIKNVGLRRCGMEIDEEYSQKVYGSNSLDFEDILMLTYRLFSEHEDVRMYISDRYKHILVDEFQDTNALQYELVKILFPIGSKGTESDEKSLFVVGDFDQSIYSWRGALPTNIDKVNKQYSDVDVHRLVANYRSTPPITTVANSILEKMATESIKSGGTGKFAPVRVIGVANEENEIEVITRLIKALGDRNTVGLLYRTNAQSRALEQGMIKAGIPYRMVGGNKFYDRKEIKDIMSYLRLLINPLDRIALERSINTPNRGIGQKTCEKFLQWVDTSGYVASAPFESYNNNGDGDVEVLRRVPTVFNHFAWLQRDLGEEVTFDDIGDLSDISECPLGAGDKKKLLEFGKLISSLLVEARTSPLPDLISTLVKRIEFPEYLRKQSDGEAQASERMSNVLELISSSKIFVIKNSGRGGGYNLDETDIISRSDSSESLEIIFEEDADPTSNAAVKIKKDEHMPPAITATSNQLLLFVQEALLYAGDVEKNVGGGDNARVSLMTIHASKGLEFDSVFVTGCEDGFLPLNAYGDATSEELDEEKRLLYVAVTRARNNLVLTHRNQAIMFRMGKMVTTSLKMSRFLLPLTSLKKDVCMFMNYNKPS